MSKLYGTGRRKKSIARVYLVPGTGNITINKRSIDEYFGLETLKVTVRQPLAATETLDKFDVLVNVHGGGTTGQAGAIRHGISRALLHADAEFRPVLKKAGFLTRDPRMKERNRVSKVLVALRSSPNINLRASIEQCKIRNDQGSWKVYFPRAFFVSDFIGRTPATEKKRSGFEVHCVFIFLCKETAAQFLHIM